MVLLLRFVQEPNRKVMSTRLCNLFSSLFTFSEIFTPKIERCVCSCIPVEFFVCKRSLTLVDHCKRPSTRKKVNKNLVFFLVLKIQQKLNSIPPTVSFTLLFGSICFQRSGQTWLNWHRAGKEKYNREKSLFLLSRDYESL